VTPTNFSFEFDLKLTVKGLTVLLKVHSSDRSNINPNLLFLIHISLIIIIIIRFNAMQSFYERTVSLVGLAIVFRSLVINEIILNNNNNIYIKNNCNNLLY